MADSKRIAIADWFYNALLRVWNQTASRAETADLSKLRSQRTRARILRYHLNRLIHVADNRLALPLIGSTAIQKPYDADWAWRPELFRGSLPVPGMSSVESKTKMGDQVTLFHDCQVSELTLRQLRNTREEDLAPYGLRMDVFRFDG